MKEGFHKEWLFTCDYEQGLINFLHQEYISINNQLSQEKDYSNIEIIEDKKYIDTCNETIREFKNLMNNLRLPSITKEIQIENIEEIKQETIDLYSNTLPIQFVEAIETTEHKKFAINPPNELSQIKQYMETSSDNDIIRFTLQNNKPLYNEISKPYEKIQVIKVVGSAIFVGYIDGRIWEYSENVNQSGKLYHNSINDKGAVTAMDISPDCKSLIAGYQKGFVILWNCINQNEKKIIANTFTNKEEEILCIQYIRYPFNNIHFFVSSDNAGIIRKYQVIEGLLEASSEVSVLYQGQSPFYLMTPLIISDKNKMKYPQFKNIKNTVIVIGNKEMIKVLFIDIETNENCFGRDLLNVSDFNYQNVKTAFFSINSLTEKRSKNILLFLSNNYSIYLYSLTMNDYRINDYYSEGSYSIDQPVFKLLLFEFPHLYFIDRTNTLNDLSMKGFRKSFISNIEDEESHIKYGNEIPEEQYLTKCFAIENEIIDKNKGQEQFERNRISLRKRDIFILQNNNLIYLKFSNWKIILRNYLKQNSFVAFLSFGLKYYNQKETDEKEELIDKTVKKKKIIAYIDQSMTQHLISLINNKKIQEIDKSQLFYMIIEFFITIKCDHLILNYIDKVFVLSEDKSLFLYIFEIFILSNQCTMLKSFSPEDTLRLFNEFFNSRYFSIPHVLLYFNLVEISSLSYYKEKCKEKKLITAIIIIEMNSLTPEYFSIIDYIFQLFQEAQEIPWDKFISYSHSYQNCSLSIFESSKQYIGHKLLWYFDICIKGFNYPNNEPISDENYQMLIPIIFYWIITSEIIIALIDFDSYSFFQVLTHLFMEDRSYKILNDLNNESNISMLALVNSIKDATINKNYYVKQDLNEFLVSIGSRIDYPREMKMNIIWDLFSFYTEIDIFNKKKTIEDRFQCHAQLLKSNSSHLNQLSTKMIAMLNSITDLTEKERERFIKISESSLYLLVRIHLEKMKGNFLICLDLYMRCDLEEKETKLFDFIDCVLEKFSNKDDDPKTQKLLKAFEAKILECSKELAELSFEKLVKLTNKWFFLERETVIGHLEECPLLQLKYIEILINYQNNLDSNSSCLDTQSNHSDDKNNCYIFIEQGELSDLVLKQIELYIKLGKRKMVLKVLKESHEFPQNECLLLCKKHNITEASIYIHQKMANYKSALHVSINEIIQNFVAIENHLTKTVVNQRQLEILIDELKRSIYQSEGVCEACTDGEEQSKDYDDLWLSLVNELYSLLNKFKSKSESNMKAREKVRKCLSDQIESILKRMCCFVSINKILISVTSNSQNVTFKEFNALLNKLLCSFNNMNNVLDSTKNLLSHSISYNVTYFQKLNIKGLFLNLSKCDACHASFKRIDNEKIFCFKCGHNSHLSCALIIAGERICKLCCQNELNDEKSNKRYTTENDTKRKSLVSETVSILYVIIKLLIRKLRKMAVTIKM